MKYSGRHISDEELDQLFRDAHASEGQEALFVPEFWSEVEAMLPAEEKKKRGFYWIPLTATLILGAMILFYPAAPARIDCLAGNQNEANTSDNKEKQHVVIAENSSVQTVQPLETTESQSQTIFRTPKKQSRVRNLNNRKNTPSVDEIPLNPMDGNKTRNPGDLVAVSGSGLNSDPHAENELDSLRLDPRYERVPHEEIAALPSKVSEESNLWYIELGPTIGQSPYLSPNQKRNVVGGAVLGGGYTKRIDNAFVTFGLQARMEGFGGLDYRETNFSQNIVRTVSVKQLYSLEVPLRFGYTFRRSEISIGVTPGVQLFIHGKEQITENQVVQRQGPFTGKVEHSNSLTMEFGLQYYYNLSPKWGIGAKINADVLRPFHTDYYLGKSAGLPVNGQIVLRRSFKK